MNKKRWVIGLLCLTVLLTALPLCPTSVLADEAEWNGWSGSDEELLAKAGLTQTQNLQFTSSFDAEVYDCTPANGSTITYTDQNGLTIFGGTEGTNWKWNNHAMEWVPFDAPVAIMFTVKLEAANERYFYAHMSYQPDRTGSTPVHNQLMIKPERTCECRNYEVNGDGVRDAEDTYYPTLDGSTKYDTFVDWMILGEGKTRSYFRRTYTEDDSNSWQYVATLQGGLQSWSDDYYGFTLTSLQGDTAYIKRIGLYEQTTGTSLPQERQRRFFDENFEGTSLPTYVNVTKNNVALSGDGVLEMTSNTGNNAVYQVTDAVIPVGGYAEFRYRAEGNTSVALGDGNNKLSFSLAKTGGLVGAAASNVVINGRTPWHTYRLLRLQDGTYTMYRKREGDLTWHEVIAASQGEKTTQTPFFRIEQETGTAWLDYLRIYGYDDGESLFLADGYTSINASEADYLKYPSTLRILMNPFPEESTLLFAAYDKKKSMTFFRKEVVPAYQNEFLFDASQYTGDNSLRVFLWDNFQTLTSLSTDKTTRVNAKWSDANWLLDGKATVDQKEEGILLTPDMGAEASATYLDRVGSEYDITWNMKISSFGGGESILISNGEKRLLLYPEVDGIRYQAGENQTQKIACEIGNTSHTYRVVYQEDACTLWVDGNSLGEIGLWDIKESSRIYFRNASKDNKAARMIISYFSATVLTPEQEKANSVAFEYDFKNQSDKNNWTMNQFQISTSNGGFLWGGGNTSCSHNINFSDDFVFETKFQLWKFGYRCGFTFMWGENYSTAIYVSPTHLRIATRACEISTDEVDLSDTKKTHNLKLETYAHAKRFHVYLDGVLLVDAEPVHRASPNTSQYVSVFNDSTTSATSSLAIDWMKFTPISYSSISLNTPYKDAVYASGEEINVSANVDGALEIPYLDYRLNGYTIGRGYAPDYQLALKNIPEGNYELKASYGEEASEAVNFTVTSMEGQVKVVDNGDGSVQVSMDELNDWRGKIAEVEYLLNGVSVAKATTKPYQATLTNVTAEGHSLTAICRDANGVPVTEFHKAMTPNLAGGKASLNYSNEVSYTVSGNSGNAGISLGNGNHILQMTHTPAGLSYQTAQGEKTYQYGIGKFHVLTDGPFADVYRNGQLVLSFIMPQSSSVECQSTNNGLQVENLNVSVPENRINYFVKRNVQDKDTGYRLPDAKKWNNVDFLAGAGDNVELALNDGYYWTKLILQNGKFYTWTVNEEHNEPYRKEIATAPTASRDVYYRVESSGGMVRLYANGEWLTSYRGILSTGEPQLGVNVISGDGLAYLSVNDYTDIYLYQDDFKGTGEFASADYWRTDDYLRETYADQAGYGMTKSFNSANGVMTLNAKGKEHAKAELNAYVGDADFSADVNLSECRGGFWLMVSHSIQQMYSKIGYNAKTGKFEVVDVTADNNRTPTIGGVSGEKLVKSVDAPALSVGKTFRVDLKIRMTDTAKQVTLYVDGNPVISHQESEPISNEPFIQRGKIGFIMTDAVANISNVSYRGDAKPILSEYDVCWGAGHASTFDMLTADDTMIMMNGSYYVRSTDGGKTWKGSYANLKSAESYTELNDGSWLGIQRVVSGSGDARRLQLDAYISTNQGVNWEKVGTLVQDSPFCTDTGNRVSQGASGRIYYTYALEDNENQGMEQLVYSDDNGKTWTKSEEIFSSYTLGHSVHEGKAIELSDSSVEPGKQHVRYWVRNERGFLLYFDSFDGGKTWEDEGHPMPMFMSANCFNVEQDLKNRNILYIAWGYDNANLSGTHQYPRTRVGLAVSEDGGNTWGYIGSLKEVTMTEGTQANMGININDDYIVVNFDGVCVTEGTKSGAITGGRYITIPREKQVALKRFERLHLRYPSQLDDLRIVGTMQEEGCMVIDPSSQDILLSGRRIEDVAYGDTVVAEYLASLVGATVETSASGVTFHDGGGSVSFDASVVSTRNGKKYINLDAFAEKYDVKVTAEQGIYIVSAFDGWGTRQCRAFRIAMDVLTDEI